MDLRQIKVAADDFGLMTYDPGFMNTASCKSRITFIDGDKGILNYRGYPIEQLAEQGNYLETAYLLLNGELPTKSQYEVWADKVTTHTFVHENVKELMVGLPLRRAPDGDAGVDDGGAQHLLPDRQARARRPGARAARQPADREDPDARRLRLPPLDGPAVRVPRQRAQLRRQLPADDVQDERAQVQGAPGARAGARRAVHPARRPRAELLDLGDARDRLLGGRPLLRGGGRDRRALRPAPRRGQRGRAADAAGDRLEGQGLGVHQGSEGVGRRGAADGLRPPRLQELRPAREDHQEDGRPGVRGHGPQPAARHRARARADSPRGRVLRQAQALPERGLLLGPDLPGDEVPDRDVLRAVRDPAHVGLARAVAGDDRGQGAAHRPPAPGLPRRPRSATTPRSTVASSPAIPPGNPFDAAAPASETA